MLEVHNPVVVPWRRHTTGRDIVHGKGLWLGYAKRDGLGPVEDDGTGLLQHPDVGMEGGTVGQLADSRAAQMGLVGLVDGAHVVPFPGVLEVVPDELTRAFGIAAGWHGWIVVFPAQLPRRRGRIHRFARAQ